MRLRALLFQELSLVFLQNRSLVPLHAILRVGYAVPRRPVPEVAQRNTDCGS